MSEQQKASAAAEETTAAAKKTPKTAKKKCDRESSDLQEQLAALQDELAAQKDAYLRLCAEYDNFRKRSAKEKADISANATARAVEGILPVLDNFDRAVASQGDAADPGFALIHRQLSDCLAALGVTELPADGLPFDPNRHVAVMHIEDDGLEQNTVAEVLQKGYLLGDKIVRPACVKVAN